MPDPLGALLSERDDKALCTGVFQALRAHYGERFDPTRVPPEHATVLLVWHSHIVICNQGFSGYFSADAAGDPDNAHMRAAYKAVGCEPTNAVLHRVFEAFPEGKPPADPRDRVRAFAKANHAVHGALNRDFLKARSALTAAVARYIRDHAGAFDELGDAATAALADVPGAATDESSDPVAAGLSDLPYWARVAFFARCGRHVLPLWDEAWPAAPADYLPIVEQSIVLAERSAAEARPAGDLKVAATHPARIAAAAMATVEGRPTPDHPPEHPERAALIAATAGSALDFVAGVDDTGSYSFAKTLTEVAGLDALLEDIQEDYARIEGLAREGEWTDKTPVPPDVFNPAYKPGKSWWKRW